MFKRNWNSTAVSFAELRFVVWFLASDFIKLTQLLFNVKHFLKVFFKKFFELFLNCSNCFKVSLIWNSFVILPQLLWFVNNNFQLFLNLLLNGEGGIWTLAPLLTTYSLSRGAPSAAWVLLQIAKYINLMKGTTVSQIFQTESVGFEPTVPFGITGFQDQLLKPLGQLSEQCSLIITCDFKNVKHFFKLFSTFFDIAQKEATSSTI